METKWERDEISKNVNFKAIDWHFCERFYSDFYCLKNLLRPIWKGFVIQHTILLYFSNFQTILKIKHLNVSGLKIDILTGIYFVPQPFFKIDKVTWHAHAKGPVIREPARAIHEHARSNVLS